MRNWRFLQFFFFMKQLSEPLTSLLELGKGPPVADKLVQRTEQPAGQHVCRDQRPHCDVLINDRESSDRGEANGCQQGQGLPQIDVTVILAAP